MVAGLQEQSNTNEHLLKRLADLEARQKAFEAASKQNASRLEELTQQAAAQSRELERVQTLVEQVSERVIEQEADAKATNEQHQATINGLENRARRLEEQTRSQGRTINVLSVLTAATTVQHYCPDKTNAGLKLAKTGAEKLGSRMVSIAGKASSLLQKSGGV